MDWVSALMLLLGLLVAFMATGLPVAFAFFAVNIVGALVFLGGEAGLEQLARNSMASLTSFTLAPIPLFLLMGEILFHTGIAFKAIDAIDGLIARVPGRLSIVSVVAGTVFSSLSGSTIANTAVLGKVLLPDGKIECTSCHDPHNQSGQPHMLVKSNRGSALCLTCHKK